MSAPELGHPGWCSQGPQCEPPRRYSDGSIEWSHWATLPVKGKPLSRAAVTLVRIEHLAVELLDAYHSHLMAVVGSRGPVEIGDSFSAQHAVAALAIAQAIVDTFAAERWQLVRDAIAGGSTVGEVGAALGGLEVAEIAAGLTSWADRKHQAGALSPDDYDAVLALIQGGAR